jgi:hypothetical protein
MASKNEKAEALKAAIEIAGAYAASPADTKVSVAAVLDEVYRTIIMIVDEPDK